MGLPLPKYIPRIFILYIGSFLLKESVYLLKCLEMKNHFTKTGKLTNIRLLQSNNILKNNEKMTYKNVY